MAGNSGIASFRFLTYKIDTINVMIPKKVSILAASSLVVPSQINFEIGFRNAGKYSISDAIVYVGGLNTKIQISDTKAQILYGEFGISGLFRPINMDDEAEKEMVRYNIPAILMPYLRSAITTIITQAGFGTVVLPLLNVYEMAKEKPIEILDFTKSSSSGPQADSKKTS
jgi:preprotein translocase subunit SecB